MTQQNNGSTNDFNSLIEEARRQIEQKQYSSAIKSLDYVIEHNNRYGYAWFLRGKAYSELKKYRPALTDYETALDIYQETEDKKFQIYTLFELSFVYTFNGKVREGFLAQQQITKIAKELDISEDDPLYPYVSHAAQMSDENLEAMESTLQNIKAIPNWDKFGLMGRMMGYATKGKLQSYLFVFVWLLLLGIPALIFAIVSSPFWLSRMIYRKWQRGRSNNE